MKATYIFRGGNKIVMVILDGKKISVATEVTNFVPAPIEQVFIAKRQTGELMQFRKMIDAMNEQQLEEYILKEFTTGKLLGYKLQKKIEG